MGSIAAELKSEREKRKISLAQIAADTHISLRHLESIEEGRYDDLPGGMYNRAFLKAYCESIRLDQREIIERFEAEANAQTGKPPRHRTQQLISGNSSFRFSPLAAWSLMLLISATGIFFSRKWITDVFSPYFAHRPQSRIIVEPPSKPAPRAAVSSRPALIQTDASAAPDSAAQEISVPSPAPPAPAQAPAAPSAVPRDLGSTTLAQASPASLELELAATEPCWISIDRDGSPAVRKTLAPGEVQSLSAAERFFVILGNAGGVQLKINGKPARQLGKSGEVIRLLINGKSLPNLIDKTTG